jgi:hypothetical protein
MIPLRPREPIDWSYRMPGGDLRDMYSTTPSSLFEYDTYIRDTGHKYPMAPEHRYPIAPRHLETPGAPTYRLAVDDPPTRVSLDPSPPL